MAAGKWGRNPPATTTKPSENRLTRLRTLLSEGLTIEETMGKDIAPLKQSWLREHFKKESESDLTTIEVDRAIGWLARAKRDYANRSGFLADRMMRRAGIVPRSDAADRLRQGEATPYMANVYRA